MSLPTKLKHFCTHQLGLIERDDLPFKEPTTQHSVIAGTVVINILALALPLTILQVYDRVLPNSSFDTLIFLVLGLSATILLDAALKYLRSYMLNWSAAAFVHNTSMDVLGRFLETPNSELENLPASERIKSINAIADLGDHLGGLSKLVAVDIFFIPVFIAIIYLVGGPLILIPVILFAAFAIATLQRTASLGALITEREKKDSRKSDFIIEVLRAVYTVKANAMEPLILRRFERLQSAASLITKRLIQSTSGTQNIGAFYATASTITVVAIGALLVFNGRMTVGGLACCMLLSSQLLQPMMRLITAWNDTLIAEHNREQISNIYKNTRESKPQTGILQNTNIGNPASITLNDVTIQFGDQSPVCSSISLNIAAGQTIAITGEDGSGRSSLLKVISGGALPHAGSVTIAGEIIDSDNRTRLRSTIRYVDQNPVIFRGSILDNLTMFGMSSVKRARWAASLIGLEPIIFKMPLGYDTPLDGQAGRSLPAATAQHISIARALATSPSTIVLDDANTALDIPGERSLIAALKRLHGKMTIVLVTHRPSIIQLADKVYQLDAGKLTPANTEQAKAG